MNAELSRGERARIIIPTLFHPQFVDCLRALTKRPSGSRSSVPSHEWQRGARASTMPNLKQSCPPCAAHTRSKSRLSGIPAAQCGRQPGHLVASRPVTKLSAPHPPQSPPHKPQPPRASRITELSKFFTRIAPARVGVRQLQPAA